MRVENVSIEWRHEATKWQLQSGILLVLNLLTGMYLANDSFSVASGRRDSNPAFIEEPAFTIATS